MKRIHIVGLSFAAVLAFGLMAASGASAAEWGLCNEASGGKFTNSLCTTLGTGNFEFKALTTSINVHSQGTLKLRDDKAPGGAVEIECEGTDKGTIGPGKEDLVSEIAEKGCKFVGTEHGSCNAATPPKAHAIHLPWKTTLELVNGEARDKIEADGSGTPGWAVECEVFFFEITDTCEGETSTKVTVLNGVIDIGFDLAGQPAHAVHCSASGENSGLVSGTVEEIPDAGEGGTTVGDLLTVGPL